MKINRLLLILLSLSVFSNSCRNIDFSEQTTQFSQQKWSYQVKPVFKFNIIDTTSRYNVFVVVRHADAYKYNNLWLKIDSRFPGDTVKSQNLDIPLASDANGWAGKGIDDIFEYRKSISPGPLSFKKAGEYSFTLSQIMRENPLEHIFNIGIRIEKVKF